MLVDSHCHLNFPDFKDDLEGVVARAKNAGVGVMQTICTEIAEFDEVRAIAQRFENIYCSVGVHPNDSGKTELPSLKELVERTVYGETIGIGETGLDYHYETSPREAQIDSFRVHIAAARETGLPLIVHSRDADEDTVRILQEEMGKGAFTGVIHCFTSTQYLADKALEMGFYISFSGIVTFKNAISIQETAKSVPLDRILVETDAPYLAPAPNRGKRNEPSFVMYTNRMIASLKAVDEATMAKHSTDNFFRLFNKARRPA